VQTGGALGGAPILHHAPWVLLKTLADLKDVRRPIVLAAVSVAPDGTVTALAPGPRRRVSVPARKLRLVAPRALPADAAHQGDLAVEDAASAEVSALARGGLGVSVADAAVPTLVLTADAVSMAAPPSVPALVASGNIRAPSVGLAASGGATSAMVTALAGGGLSVSVAAAAAPTLLLTADAVSMAAPLSVPTLTAAAGVRAPSVRLASSTGVSTAEVAALAGGGLSVSVAAAAAPTLVLTAASVSMTVPLRSRR
jgi:hypothetical protein